MGFLDNVFNTKNNLITSWLLLTDMHQIDELVANSNKKTVVIFKHSTRCGISMHAKDRLESNWDIDADSVDFYYLDLLNYRPISNAIAEKLGVMHQSPQLIVLKNGKVIHESTHSSISLKDLKTGIQAA